MTVDVSTALLKVCKCDREKKVLGSKSKAINKWSTFDNKLSYNHQQST